MNRAAKGIIAVAAAQIIWGFSTPALKIALGEIPAFSAIFIRFGIATLIAAPFFLTRPYQRIERKDLAKLALVCVFGLSLHMAFFAVGLSLSKVIVAALIIAISPIATSMAAIVFLKEKSSIAQIVGILIGFCGTLILILHPLALGSGQISFDLVGTMLLFAAMILGTIFVIGSKELFSKYTPMTISFYSFLFTTVAFLPFAFVETINTPTWITGLTLAPAVAIVFSGVFASFAAYLLFEWGLSRSQVETIAPLNYLTPAVSFIIGILFFKDSPDIWIFISAAIILIGVYLATIRKPHHHLHTRHHI